jgi:hypothetical protein
MENKSIYQFSKIVTGIATIFCIFKTAEDAPFYLLGAIFFAILCVLSIIMLRHENKLLKKNGSVE